MLTNKMALAKNEDKKEKRDKTPSAIFSVYLDKKKPDTFYFCLLTY